MSKSGQTATAIGVIGAAVVIGASVTYFQHQQSGDGEAHAGQVLIEKGLKLIGHSLEYGGGRSKRELTEKEIVALAGLVNEVVDASQADGSATIPRLKVLFDAADQDPDSYAHHADFVARKLIARIPHTPAGEFAQHYRVLAMVRDGVAESEWFDELARFACDYEASDQPIQLYRRLTDDLLNNGDGTLALQLLDHGIAHCKSDRMQEELSRYRALTQQTVALLGQVRSRAAGSAHGAQHGPRKTQTAEDSEYFRYIGERMDIAGPTLQGKAVTRQDVRGEWLLVHFWATWCGTCRTSVPNLVPLERKYAGRGVKFVGVNMDEDAEAAVKFMEAEGFDWPQIAAETESGWESPLAEQHSIDSIPICFLVSPQGTIVEAGRARQVCKSIDYHLGGGSASAE